MDELAQTLFNCRPRPIVGAQKERAARILWLLLTGLMIFPAVAAAQSPPARKVLILHSYHFGYDWTESIAAGIRSVFQENHVTAELHVEFMDARRHNTPSDLARLHDYYKYKFQGLEFDVIIASDNAALNFLLQNHQALFPQTPVVFYGVDMMARSSRP